MSDTAFHEALFNLAVLVRASPEPSIHVPIAHAALSDASTALIGLAATRSREAEKATVRMIAAYVDMVRLALTSGDMVPTQPMPLSPPLLPSQDSLIDQTTSACGDNEQSSQHTQVLFFSDSEPEADDAN